MKFSLYFLITLYIQNYAVGKTPLFLPLIHDEKRMDSSRLKVRPLMQLVSERPPYLMFWKADCRVLCSLGSYDTPCDNYLWRCLKDNAQRRRSQINYVVYKVGNL